MSLEVKFGVVRSLSQYQTEIEIGIKLSRESNALRLHSCTGQFQALRLTYPNRLRLRMTLDDSARLRATPGDYGWLRMTPHDSGLPRTTFDDSDSNSGWLQPTRYGSDSPWVQLRMTPEHSGRLEMTPDDVGLPSIVRPEILRIEVDTRFFPTSSLISYYAK